VEAKAGQLNQSSGAFSLLDYLIQLMPNGWESSIARVKSWSRRAKALGFVLREGSSRLNI
jgi:hypothetical protein